MDFARYEEIIIDFFKQELKNQGKKTPFLGSRANPESTMTEAKAFRIFNRTHRLAFADFMQICHLLKLEPQLVIEKAVNTVDGTNISISNSTFEETQQLIATLRATLEELEEKLGN